jgi:hypothetical protein
MARRIGAHHDCVASQPSRLLDDLLRGRACADHACVSLDALAPQPRNRLLHHLVLPVPLLLRGQKAGVGKAEGRSPHPGDAEHVHRRVRSLSHAGGEVHRRPRDFALLGREEDRAYDKRVRVRQVPRSLPGDHSDATTPGGIETVGSGGAWRLSSIFVLYR